MSTSATNFEIDWDALLVGAMHQGRVYQASNRHYSIHGLYGYPARFSPTFVRQSLNAVTKSGFRVLDPFMGSGTTLIESLRKKLPATGIDLSPISSFLVERITRGTSVRNIEHASETSYEAAMQIGSSRRNMRSIGFWPTEHEEDAAFNEIFRILERFVARAHEVKGETGKIMRLIALAAGQWAIDGRREPLPRAALVERLLTLSVNIPNLIAFWNQTLDEIWGDVDWRKQIETIHGDSAVALSRMHNEGYPKFDLAITSPPYPGVHVLYAKWQLRGRRETNLPSFIVNSQAKPESFLTMGSRFSGDQQYFKKMEEVVKAVRKNLKPNALFIQLVGFSDSKTQMPRYLELYSNHGFEKLAAPSSRNKSVSREVPSRKWHASVIGNLETKREHLLVFRRI
jgi:DNA modification methylase